MYNTNKLVAHKVLDIFNAIGRAWSPEIHRHRSQLAFVIGLPQYPAIPAPQPTAAASTATGAQPTQAPAVHHPPTCTSRHHIRKPLTVPEWLSCKHPLIEHCYNHGELTSTAVYMFEKPCLLYVQVHVFYIQ